MKELAALLFFLVQAGSADARDCSQALDVRDMTGISKEIPSRAFFLCLLAEIEDLKRKQAQLAKIIPNYERLVAELPTHYSNADGVITQEEGRLVGSAGFSLTARQLGGPISLELAQHVLDAVCAAPKGCLASLTFRRKSIRGDDPVETQKVGPCEFETNPATGRWIIGPGCGTDASRAGTDGDGVVTTPGSGAVRIIEVGPGCLFSDADIRPTLSTKGDALGADHAIGFFLVADPSQRQDGVSRFECSLELG